ncbi:hypothetical protein CF15_06975 [Pyrodictium occultum]|uniref:SIS domain-containing protein n=1 Tax=Pyrodictium occultum TaxID=2309 RepID=A0A0V8RWM7_PYROC|nr:SIS domain-containing protein [Pyrodictium occultum]KSW12459.1 hypothetical protein CF15_06975 [Pyrodictium occultum]
MAGFYEYYLGWAGPARRAYSSGVALQLPQGYARAGEVVVCGMGGSGAAGDYLAALSARYGGLPVYVVKSAEPPAWVRGSLVYAVSFSGNTRETLSCASRAYRLGGLVVAVTTGGRLASWARSVGAPVALVEEAPAPRAGWPQLFYTLLGSLKAAGLIQVPESHVEESLQLLGERERAEAEAGELVAWLRESRGRLAVLAPEPYYPVAVRAVSELAENAKTSAVAMQVPEAGHNLLEALARDGDSRLLLIDPGEEPWSTLLHEFAGLARPASIHVARLQGGSPLSRMVWGTWLAGLASVRLALEEGLEPEPVKTIKAFRRVVEETSGWDAHS